MEPTAWQRFKRIYLFVAIGFPLLLGLVQFLPPDGPTCCAFRLVTHLDCPGCGMTRAMRAMGRLDVLSAFRYNPLGPAVFLCALVFWGYAAGQVLTGGRVRVPSWWLRHRTRLAYLGTAILLLVGVWRIVHERRHPPPPPRIPFAEWRPQQHE